MTEMMFQFIILAQTSLKFNWKLARFYSNERVAMHVERLHELGIDITLGPFAILSRHQLSPIISRSYDMFVREPSPTLPSTYFLSVFSIELWICIISTIAIIVTWLAIHHKLNKLTFSNIFDSILNTFGVAPSNEIFNIPSQKSLNLVNTVTSIFCFFIATGLSAFLISELLTISYKFPFTGMDDFLNQNEYALCIPNDEYVYNFIPSKFYGHKLFNGEKCGDIPYRNTITVREKLCNNPKAILIHLSETLTYNDNKYDKLMY